MRIEDVLNKTKKENDILSKDEILKTAELLEVFSSEDTLVDDLAKLAVFQDIFLGRIKNESKRNNEDSSSPT